MPFNTFMNDRRISGINQVYKIGRNKQLIILGHNINQILIIQTIIFQRRNSATCWLKLGINTYACMYSADCIGITPLLVNELSTH